MKSYCYNNYKMQAKTFLRKMTMVPTCARTMSSASIADRFQHAYQERVDNLAKTPKKP